MANGRKRKVQKAGKADNEKKAIKRTDTSKSGNAGKPANKKQIQAPRKIKKVRANDPKTGYLKWVTPGIADRWAEQREAKRQSREQDRIDYSLITTNAGIKRVSPIRYKGRFISKKANEAILNFSADLDSKGVDYTLEDLLKVKNIQNKILVVRDVTPKEQFYWNLENMIEAKKFGENVKIKIIDFDGSVIYDGKSSQKARDILEKANRKLENLEKVIEQQEETNAYFTIPVYETTVGTDIVELQIDLADIKGRLPDDTLDKYKTML